MKVIKNGVEIEYSDALLNKIREAYDLRENEEVSDEQIVSFFKIALDDSIVNETLEKED